jgi:endo-1,4-beta-D-glucanase Y
MSGCRFVSGGLIWLIAMLPACAQPCADWPLWRAFDGHFIQADGRVLADESEQRFSTSEGQAYSLFFALVANDRTAFDRILVWTRDNLASGDLTSASPAWKWGRKPDGGWGVVDNNSASDADSWLAYTLLEAGRLWHEPRYTAQGQLMLANIRIHLIRRFPDAVALLLPGMTGFDIESGGVRLNPSYYPVQLLRNFSKADPSGPWRDVIDSNLKLLRAASPHGFVPDWLAYVPGQGYLSDTKSAAVGSYDAIRVYLWWGMLSRQDPMSAKLRNVIFGMNQMIPKHEIAPPLTVDTQTGAASGISPPGFSSALLPYFSTMGNSAALRLQQERLAVHTQPDGLVGQDLRYYDQVLALFGNGWLAHRFSFSPQGQLVVKWTPSCIAEN